MRIYFVLLLQACSSFLFSQSDSCSVRIVQDTTENGILLRAEIMGTPPFEYFWGDNTFSEATIPNGTGNYVVTIADAAGCGAAAEIEYIDRDSSNFLIEGRIRNRGNNREILFEGTVFLYQKLTEVSYELIDSTAFGSIGDWSPFSFGSVDAGTYILQAVLNSDSDGFDEFIPTYYGSTTQWQNAAFIHIPYSGTRSLDMLLYSKKIAEGRGIISGKLTEKENLNTLANSRNYTNLSAHLLFLLDENNRILSSTYTAEDGNFQFTDIPFDSYKIQVEKTGYISEEILVDLTAENPNSNGLQFIVDHSTKRITSQLNNNSNKPKTIAKNKIWQNVIYPIFWPETIYIHYQFLNDTIINGQSYEQLYLKDLSLPEIKWRPLNTFLREEQGKIYSTNNDLSESLLYDFSLNVNDTFHLQTNSTNCVFLVTAVDSIALSNTEKRKRITLIQANEPNPTQPEYGYNYWVEGIGSLTSLVNYGRSCYTDYDLDLLCYYEESGLAYENSNNSNCLLTSIKATPIPTIKIFPNPSQDFFFIESPETITNLNIYNNLGQLMKIDFNSQQVDISHLSKGIYFIHLQTKDKHIYSQKFLKNSITTY